MKVGEMYGDESSRRIGLSNGDETHVLPLPEAAKLARDILKLIEQEQEQATQLKKLPPSCPKCNDTGERIVHALDCPDKKDCVLLGGLSLCRGLRVGCKCQEKQEVTKNTEEQVNEKV